jgi:hypothetical protein
MIPYWLMFLLAALPALDAAPRMKFRADGTRNVLPNVAWLLVICALTVVIGFRYNVGGDWWSYFRYLDDAAMRTLDEVILQDDPGYRLLNWIAVQYDWGKSGVNTMSGALFAAGLVLFCRSLPRPWLALAVAVPYVVIVVGMGYTRQAVALGMVMAGLVALGRQKFIGFVICVLIGATFHKSAVLIIPLAALVLTRNKLLGAALVLASAAIAYVVLLQDHADRLVAVYTDDTITSEGALIRLAMNFVPAFLFLRYRHRFMVNAPDFRLWQLFSFISIAMFLAYFVTPLSTALDRLALYMIPLQMVVFSHLPDLIGRPGRRNVAIVMMVIGYMALVLFVWLNFATHSRFWIPYRIVF